MKTLLAYICLMYSACAVSQNAIKFDYDKGGNMSQKQVRILNMRLNTSQDSVLKFNVFPNPAKDQFTIEGPLTEGQKNAGILLYDSNGALVQKDEYHGVKKSYPLSSLASGVYFLEIKYSEAQSSHYKIVITQ